MESILRISEAANLGIHAMACLVGFGPDRAVSVTEIADLLSVSKDHLGKVLQRLAKVGLVTSKRGPKGGFTIAKETEQTTLLEILEAIDGPMTSNPCLLGQPICGGQCIMGDLVSDLHRMVHDYLSSTRLEDLSERSPLVGKLRQSKGQR
jgi:Rrf2 family protein